MPAEMPGCVAAGLREYSNNPLLPSYAFHYVILWEDALVEGQMAMQANKSIPFGIVAAVLIWALLIAATAIGMAWFNA